MNPSSYFRQYRTALGFTRKDLAKEFMAGKDILPDFDEPYAIALLERIRELFTKLNTTIWDGSRVVKIDRFLDESIDGPYRVIKSAGILPRLNNLGRRPEQVLFNWLRGHVAQEYFRASIEILLELKRGSIRVIGDDNLADPATFKRTPTADLEAVIDGRTCRIEVQSGFQGVNDIKEHKVREARRVRESSGARTLCIHFDVFNGQAAVVQIDAIHGDDVNWVTRQQMEGQSVFAIDQNSFVWRLLDPPPGRESMELEVFS